MCGGREANDHQSCLGIAERGHGASPIGPVAIGAALGARDFLAVVHQARALAAIRDFALEHRELVLWRLASNVKPNHSPRDDV